MSYKEALKDGIRAVNENGRTVYYPRCQFCGVEVRSWSYLPHNRYTCKACRPYKAIFLKTDFKL